MKLLLDTHALLWHFAGSASLSERARVAIEHVDAEVFASVASLWEIAIKLNAGKLALSYPFAALHAELLPKHGFQLLAILPRHLDLVASLPRHHRDPFDHLLVARALVENIEIVSNDSALDSYGVRRLW